MLRLSDGHPRAKVVTTRRSGKDPRNLEKLHNAQAENREIRQPSATKKHRKKFPRCRVGEVGLARIRESELWGNLVDEVGAKPEGCQWIHVFDRGGDNFEAICHIALQQCDWVIRAAKLNRNVFTEDDEKVSLEEALSDAQLMGSYELNLRSRPGVKARTARIEVSKLRVTFPRPGRVSKWVKQCGIDQLATNVVVVQEVDAPPGVKPIRWILLTSLPVATFEDCWQVIEDYENRWLIEEYHKVLKTGCSVENHALRTAARLEALTGVITVLSTRLLQLKLIGRSQREAKAQTHVPSSWLTCMKLARPKLRLTRLTVYEFFRELAKMGGFIGRTGDGEPGWQTIWHGYKKLQGLLDGMRLAGAI